MIPGSDPWVRKIFWRREWLLTPIFWPGEFHGLYSPWHCKESDVTEQLSVAKAVTYPFLTDVGIDKFTKISRQQF